MNRAWQAAATTDGATRGRLPNLGAALLIVAGVLAVYWRAIGFDYVQLDDYEYTVLTTPVMNGLSFEGVHWAFTTMRLANWHPLTWISLMTDVTLFGPGPGPQHAVNLALHVLNTLLVHRLALALLARRDAALVVALLFGVHALHVESVAWIAERKDLLCALFYLLALLLHLRYAALGGVQRYLWLQAAAVLALLSKPMAVTLPVALLLLDAWPLRRLVPSSVPRLLVEKLPLIVAVAAVCVLTIVAQQGAMAPLAENSFAFRLQNSANAYAIYVRQLILPTGLTALYRLQPIEWAELFASGAVLVALSAIAIRLRATRPWLCFGWLWFLLTLIPVVGLVQVGSQAHADRYMYLPSIGLLIALGGELAARGNDWWRRWRVAMVAVLVFHALMAWIQLGYWANPYMLNTRILDLDPDSYQAHVALAGYFLGRHDTDRAQHHALQALALNTSSFLVYMSLGNVFLARHDNAQAEHMFRTVLVLAPQYPMAVNNLGLALEQMGRLDEARACFAEARRLDPALRGVEINIARLANG